MQKKVNFLFCELFENLGNLENDICSVRKEKQAF
jgi:hypothetical protein